MPSAMFNQVSSIPLEAIYSEGQEEVAVGNGITSEEQQQQQSNVAQDILGFVYEIGRQQAYYPEQATRDMKQILNDIRQQLIDRESLSPVLTGTITEPAETELTNQTMQLVGFNQGVRFFHLVYPQEVTYRVSGTVGAYKSYSPLYVITDVIGTEIMANFDGIYKAIEGSQVIKTGTDISYLHQPDYNFFEVEKTFQLNAGTYAIVGAINGSGFSPQDSELSIEVVFEKPVIQELDDVAPQTPLPEPKQGERRVGLGSLLPVIGTISLPFLIGR
jgi:hypothetical protein